MRMLFLCLSIFLVQGLSAQTVFNFAKETNVPQTFELDKQFSSYQVFRAEASELFEALHKTSGSNDLILRFEDTDRWNMSLHQKFMIQDNYSLKTSSSGESKGMTENDILTYNGSYQDPNQGKIALTVTNDIIYGFVEKSTGTYFIEPVHYVVNGASHDLYVVYNESDVLQTAGTCAATNKSKKEIELQEAVYQAGQEKMNCFLLEFAIASDFSMFQKHGSVSGVEGHVLGVLNNAQTNYDDEFNNEIVFEVVTQFVVDCAGCDPWVAGNDAGSLLSSFRQWGNAGNFGVSYDLGQLWTDRNISSNGDSGTVGVAYVGGLCNSFKYQLIEDFSSTAWRLRVVVSHETGHNFDQGHDAAGSPFIMAPSVNNTNAWSAASTAGINATINAEIASGCFEPCVTVNPPVADFSSDQQSGCVPLFVNFTDQSTNSPDTWQWDFPGGTPSSSSSPNPSVTYLAPGQYDVTLTVSNSAGSDTKTTVNYISVFENPTADFNFVISGRTVVFTNNSIGDTWLWDFDDGSSSTAQNPVYTYTEDGVYNVTLISTNGCGAELVTMTVTILTPPTAAFEASDTSGCKNLTVIFTDLSSSNATDRLWSFPGGTPNSSTDQFPVIVYSTPGTYDVSLEVSNGAGMNTATETDFITILEDPVASFTYASTDLTVDFTNNSTDALTFLWDFGDTNTSTEQSPTHTYSSGGMFAVKLTAYGTCDTVSITQVVTLSAIPTANASADVTQGCADLSVTFSDLSTNNPTSWAWSFVGGNPSSSSAQNPQIVYNNAGTYSVQLIASNASGADTITLNNYITVDDVPIVGFGFSTSNTTANFTNTSTNADSYSWDFGDGNTSAETNPNHDYGADGTYTVTLTGTNVCGNQTSVQTVEIANAPTAGATANVTSGCADLTVQFSDQSSINATAWSWTFPGGNPSSSTSQNPVVVYSNEGVFNVELVASNNTGSDQITLTDYININDVPNAGYSVSVMDMDANFTNTTTNADTYIWDFGDGNMSSSSSPSHSYASDGAYTVTLTATNICGDDIVSQVVNISNAPTAGATANVTSGCAPLEVNFTDLSSTNTTTWNWTFEGGTPSTSTSQHPTVIYNAQGSFDVTLEVSNSEGSNSLVFENYIIVEEGPTSNFMISANELNVNFNNNSSNGDSFNWDFGDGNSSTSENPSHNYSQDGTYTVVLTSTNNCGTDTHTEIITVVSQPSAGFSIGDANGCEPFTVQFNDLSSDNTTSWNWTFEGGTPASSTNQNPVIIFENAGQFDVTLVVTNAAGSDETTMQNAINVGAMPSASFSSSTSAMEVSFLNQSMDANSFSWDFGDGNSSTLENPMHTYSTEEIFTVTLTVTNNCGTDVSTELINLTQTPLSNFSYSQSEGCAGLEVQYMDNSTGTVTDWNWSFPGGTPSASTDQHPLVTYSSPGVYDVVLEVSSAAGTDTHTETEIVTILSGPTADFTFSNTDFDFTFMNNSSQADSYNWNFGDGNSSVEENPMHSYSSAGSYEVILTVSNSCGTNEYSSAIEVVAAPVGAFTANATSGCLPFTVQMIDESSDNVTSWNWSFPGGTPASSTAQNPSVVYNESGVYSITLEVANSAGTFNVTRLDYIEVGENPVATFTSVATDNSVSFTNTSTGANSYLWAFGDGTTSMDQNPIHVYSANGTYEVTLTVTNDCGATSQTSSVTISNLTLPSALFMSAVQEGCAPTEITFIDASSDNTETWSWIFEGGSPATSTDQNPVVSYNTPGVYDVQLTVGNAEGEDVLLRQEYIMVNDIPSAAFGFAAMDLTVSFDAEEVNGISYSWDFGDGNMASVEDPNHVYAVDGTYEVSLKVENVCGTFTTTKTVIVAEGISAPIADFSSDSQGGCSPTTISFSDLSTNNPSSWFWEFEGGDPATSTEQNPVVVYNAGGNFNVQLTATNAAGENNVLKTDLVSINDSPIADFNYVIDAAEVVSFENLSNGSTSFSWDFGDDVGTSTEKDPTYSYSAAGIYTVTLVVTNPCGEDTYTQEITVGSTANVNLEEFVNIDLFPNPTAGEFSLVLNSFTGLHLELAVYNTIGQLQLVDNFFQTGKTIKSYDLKNVASGTYFVKITCEEGSAYRKLIVSPK